MSYVGLTADNVGSEALCFFMSTQTPMADIEQIGSMIMIALLAFHMSGGEVR